MNHVLILGCGDIGCRIAAHWAAQGMAVTGVARTAETGTRIQAAGGHARLGDLDQPASLADLPWAGTLVYYLVPPPAGGTQDPRVRGLLAALPGSARPVRLVYLSTSGVYGDCGGAWVSENRPPNPQTERAQRRLDAEQALTHWSHERDVPLAILRVGGIYGPGRLPLRQLRAGRPMLRAELAPFSNRIHADDLAAVCVAAGQPGRPAGIYNVSDGAPSTMTDYFDAVADAAGLPRPRKVDWAEARQVLSPEMLSYLQESRRLDTTRMRELLQVTLRYPELREGLAASIAEAGPSGRG